MKLETKRKVYKVGFGIDIICMIAGLFFWIDRGGHIWVNYVLFLPSKCSY